MYKSLYLGLDAHTRVCVLAAMDSMGRVISTSESSLFRHVLELPAKFKYLALEESSLADWIASALRPHVTQLIVCEGTIRWSAEEIRMIVEMLPIFADFFDWGN